MDEDGFWQIIDSAKTRSKGDLEQQVEFIEKDLIGLPEDDIYWFHEHFTQKQDECYSKQFWRVAEQLNGFTSDDGFENFQGWLIAQGRDFFLEAIRDPDSVMKQPQNRNADGSCELEQFVFVAQTAFEKKTGKNWYEDD